MADLCGPSNALQNFQKHSTVDRTLQQDRLIARQSPSQGFRSSPGPNAGLLDPEFEAFQAGKLSFDGQTNFNPQLSGPSTPLRHQQSHPLTPQSLQQPGPSGWASDFQRLQISNPQPSAFQQSQFHGPAQQRQDTGGWHQDFAQQFQGGQQGIVMQPGHMGGQVFGSQYSPLSQGMGMGMGMQQNGGGMMGQTGHLQQQSSDDVFDDAAFARAFEEASNQELERLSEESRQEQAANVEMDDQVLLDESAERFISLDQSQIPNQAPIGADLIQDPKQNENPQGEDQDALSRTAAHLLSSVSNNTSSKFANSEFLSLMRQLRDKEVKVDGDDIVGAHEVEEMKSLSIAYLLSRLDNLSRVRAPSRSVIRALIITLLQFHTQLPITASEAKDEYEEGMERLAESSAIWERVAESPTLKNYPVTKDLAAFSQAILIGAPLTDSPIAESIIEITRFLPPLEQPFDTTVSAYIHWSLQSDSAHATQERKQWLEKILGYEFSSTRIPNITNTTNVHMQRAREIMGRSVCAVIDLCQPFWCPSLDLDEFELLVAVHEKYGLTSATFVNILEEIEAGIERSFNSEIEAMLARYGYELQDMGYAEASRLQECEERVEKIQRARELRRGMADEERIRGELRVIGREWNDNEGVAGKEARVLELRRRLERWERRREVLSATRVDKGYAR